MNPSQDKYYGVILFLIFQILSGCQSGVYLMPTPVAFQSGKHDPFSHTPERDKGGDIVVAYGTNRLPSDDGNYYAREFDQNLRMGTVRVKIGDGD